MMKSVAGDIDPYAVLGVGRDASTDDVRDAFRRAVRALHPDHHGGVPADHAALTDLVEAWTLLGDPRRRAEFDAGAAGPPTSPAGPRRDWSDPPRSVSSVSIGRLRLLFATAVMFTALLVVVFTLIAFAQSG